MRNLDLADQPARVQAQESRVAVLVGGGDYVAVVVVVGSGQVTFGVGDGLPAVGQVVGELGGEVGRVGGGVLFRVDDGDQVADVVVGVGQLVAVGVGANASVSSSAAS